MTWSREPSDRYVSVSTVRKKALGAHRYVRYEAEHLIDDSAAVQTPHGTIVDVFEH